MDKNYGNIYNSITAGIRENTRITGLLKILNHALVFLMYIAYGVLLLRLYMSSDQRLLQSLLVPAVSFVLLSLIRKKINRPRPYETWPIKPIILKDTKGNSMPSRHVFSSVIISMTWLHILPPVGIALLIVSLVTAAVRVIGGVHYISDVAVGYIVGLLAGLILFIL